LCCRAQEIGDILMRAFDTPTGIPHGTINLKSLRSYNPSWAGGASGEVQALQRHASHRSALPRGLRIRWVHRAAVAAVPCAWRWRKLCI